MHVVRDGRADPDLVVDERVDHPASHAVVVGRGRRLELRARHPGGDRFATEASGGRRGVKRTRDEQDEQGEQAVHHEDTHGGDHRAFWSAGRWEPPGGRHQAHDKEIPGALA